MGDGGGGMGDGGEVGGGVAVAGDGGAGEVEGAVVAVKHDLHDRLRGEVGGVPDRRDGRRHRPAGVVLQLRGEALDERRVDERLVALDVHEDVVVVEVAPEEVPRRAGDAVGAARQVARRHDGRAAVRLDGLHDAVVVRRDQHRVEALGLLDRLDDPRDERLAGEDRERLAGKPARPEPAGNDSVCLHAGYYSISAAFASAGAGRLRGAV